MKDIKSRDIASLKPIVSVRTDKRNIICLLIIEYFQNCSKFISEFFNIFYYMDVCIYIAFVILQVNFVCAFYIYFFIIKKYIFLILGQCRKSCTV